MTGSGNSNRRMKVAVLSSASGGGAGIAAKRVTDALNLSSPVEADFLDMVALGGRVPDDAAPPGNMSNRRISDTHFTVEFPGYVRGWVVDVLRQYDLLNIHWASFLLGLAEIDELARLGVPMLFTCHDYYYFSGGCHYPATCDLLAKGCIACPQVNLQYCPSSTIALNRRIKKAILGRANVQLAAPSAFLANEVVRAKMISAEKVHVLRNPYSPVADVVRRERNQPPGIVLLADSMAERRKAMPLAIESLSLAWQELRGPTQNENPFVVHVIGNADDKFKAALALAGFEYILHGRIASHQKIAFLLSQCDFLLSCSFEDNWPNVLVEAGSYGVIPIVGPGHGCEEFVRCFGIGEVAFSYDKACFSRAIVKALESSSEADHSRLRESVVREHDPEHIAKAYVNSFASIISQK